MTNKKKRPRVDMTLSKAECQSMVAQRLEECSSRRRCGGEEEKEEPTTTGRIYRYHPKRNAAPKFFSVVSSDPVADVPPKLWSFAHCIMENASTGELLDRSPLVFDLDAKAKPGFPLMSTSNESGGDNAKRHRLAVRRVRFAVYQFVKMVVERVLMSLSSTTTTTTTSEKEDLTAVFAISDASSERKSSKGGARYFKFSYHIVVRLLVKESGEAATFEGPSESSLQMARAMNIMLGWLASGKHSVVRFPVAIGKKKEEEEQRDFETWLTSMAAILCSAMECGEGPVFDEQIYKSRSLRLVGASRPGGGSRLVPVNLANGNLGSSTTTSDDAPVVTSEEARMHDPYPSPEEAAANGTRVVVVSATLRSALQDAMTAYAVEEDKDKDDADGDGLYSLAMTTMTMEECVELEAAVWRARRVKQLVQQPSMLGGGGGGSSSDASALLAVFSGGNNNNNGGRKRMRTGKRISFDPVVGNEVCSKLFGMLCKEIGVPAGGGGGVVCGAFASRGSCEVLAEDGGYEVRSVDAFCPWKCVRCNNNKDNSRHNSNRVMMHVCPKSDREEAHLKLFCFSAQCVAHANSLQEEEGGGRRGGSGVAMARYPGAKGARPSMALAAAIGRFVGLLGGK